MPPGAVFFQLAQALDELRRERVQVVGLAARDPVVVDHHLAVDDVGAGLPQVGDTIQYSFPGLTLGKPYNYPQWLYQNNFESRYDLSWHRNTHDLKIGAEFMYTRGITDKPFGLANDIFFVLQSLPAFSSTSNVYEGGPF